MAAGATGATGPTGPTVSISSVSGVPASVTWSGLTLAPESADSDLGPSRVLGMDQRVAVQSAALRHHDQLPVSRVISPGVTGATGPTGPTGGTAFVANPLPAEFRLSDGLHVHQELKLVAHIGPPARVVEPHTATLGSPLEVVVFLLALVAAIAAGQLWHRALEFVAPQRRSIAP